MISLKFSERVSIYCNIFTVLKKIEVKLYNYLICSGLKNKINYTTLTDPAIKVDSNKAIVISIKITMSKYLMCILQNNAQYFMINQNLN